MKEQYLYILPPIPDKRFPIYVEKQTHVNKEELFRPHWHEHLELIFMLSGELMLTCNAQKIHGKTNDLLILNPNDLHHLHSITAKVEYYCIIFDLKMIKSLTTDLGDLDFLLPLSENKIIFDTQSKSTQDINRCLVRLVREYNGDNLAKPLIVKSLLMEMVSLLFTQCKYTKQEQEKRNSSIKLIQNILLYLNKNYNKSVDISVLAKNFNISYHHLCHLFKDYTNMSIIKYLSEIRIEKSLRYLEETSKSITEISALVGYEDSNYFSRVFKKIMHKTPREYVKDLNL
ncbi:AraC family transcriptional regulator [Thiospirochaeta perfilievii]|uniref:AraC family transcriptional regulator n=1 Tax=Thiospirochaeta perfilievii TaxID=252967 RepID=A0A5C1QDZ2_9SPIO|nr:AraC family transcriptional regulator [Thiospirochaeta perfilievii]QEN05290.1 AraC family transcriptional regulator [Thiospirochaeta perfilievii]